MNSRLQCKIGLFVGAFFIGSSAWAVGFESSIPFGARTAGSAGIAAPDISGAQSLFFNPAGLVGQKGQQVSLQDSPTWAEVKAPIDDQNDISKTSTFAPPGGLFYSYTPNSKWGFGAGYYVAGGNSISYDGLNINSGLYGSGTVKDSVELQLMEFSLGAGYQVNDKLRVGIAWRAMFANASFASIQRGTSNSLVNAEVENLAGHSLKGFRIGAQYEVSPNTEIGLTYRSPMDVRTKGNFAGQVLVGGAAHSIEQSHAEVATTLPQAINLGVAHRLSDTWKILGEYDWLNYSHVDHVTIDGTIKVTSLGMTTDATDMTTNWKDQHEIRIAAEYTGWALPLRFGYLWSSQVTSEDYAKPTTTPPGMGHGLTAGTSYKVGSFDLDGAVEYSIVEGNVNGAKAGETGPGKDIRDGKYTMTSLGAHLGVTYSF